jgi:transposase
MAVALAVALLLVEAHMPTRKPKAQTDRVTDSLVKALNPHAAGIDLGASSHWVAVPEGAVPEGPAPQRARRGGGLPARVRRFGTCTADLRNLSDWLKQAGVDTVAMEATGVYWVALYDLLEAEGFRVLLVDPHQVRNAPGRPKTDVKDCMWIQRLHSLGLLTAAFRPEEPIRVLRCYQRQRQSLVEDQGRHILRLQKALEQMNLKLTETVKDVAGVTGLAIIKAIVAGVRDPEELARLRQPGCKRPEAEFVRALEGTWQAEHLFALRQALTLFEFYQQQLAEVDEKLAEQLRALARPEKPRPLPPPTKPRRRRRNDLHFEARELLYGMAAVDLTAIEGIDVQTALVVLSEIGTDMGRWRSERAFGAWLGLAPNPRKTGGKLKSARTRPGVSRAAQALRVAAQSLHRSKSALGAFYRRIASRRGAAKAITAAAYKLARIIYAMLKHGQEYVQKGLQQYEAEYRERLVRNLKKKAAELGLELMEKGPQLEAAASQG